ncbi:amidohydrolase family protein [Candidatus Poriferisocius sp.]|uniref:amidohydrolase family protein n=1 Tax=Candidatus Poriferisocius sp. TaxID=3101276 RepID=UPI003B02107D
MLKSVMIVDGTGTESYGPADLVIEDGIITRIVTDDEDITAPEDALVIDLTGRYLIPGLIDGHTHLTRGPDHEPGWFELQEMFLLGITSVRDMAGNGKALKVLQDRAASAEEPVPTVYWSALVAGPRWMRSDGRAQETAGEDTPGEVGWLQPVDAGTDIEALVARAKESGAHGIKLYDDIDGELAGKVIAEAQKQGILTWAHPATFPGAPKDYVNAGVQSVSHAGMLFWHDVDPIPAYDPGDHSPLPPIRPGADPYSPTLDQLFESMAQAGVIIDATLALHTNPDASNDAERLDVTHVGALVSRAHDRGVRISVGTDCAATIAQEAELLVKHAGLTPIEAIQSATQHNAMILGIDSFVGTIAVGMAADLVVLTGDPTADITELESVQAVIRAGRLHEVSGPDQPARAYRGNYGCS